MTNRTLLRIERAADLALIVVEYCCYVIIVGAIGLGWVVTS